MDPSPAEPSAGQSARDAPGDRTPESRTHAVTFDTGGWRIVVGNVSRGITMAADHLAWTRDNKNDSALYRSIVEVRLTTAGAPQLLTHVCEITFADGYKLRVTDNNEFGIPTKIQRAAYQEFLRDLHARLVAVADKRDRPPIAFIAGFDRKNYVSLSIRMALWTIVFVGAPLAIFLMTGEVTPFLLLIGAIFFGVTYWMMIQKNAPGTYDPARLPDDLIGNTGPAWARNRSTQPPKSGRLPK